RRAPALPPTPGFPARRLRRAAGRSERTRRTRTAPHPDLLRIFPTIGAPSSAPDRGRGRRGFSCRRFDRQSPDLDEAVGRGPVELIAGVISGERLIVESVRRLAA